MPRKVVSMRHRHVRFTLPEPGSCAQCGSLVWTRMDYWEDLLTPARLFQCAGCGREEYEAYREGRLVRGIRPARCRCCQRILADAFSAVEGYGPECMKGTCTCGRRRRQSLAARTIARKKPGHKTEVNPVENYYLWDYS